MSTNFEKKMFMPRGVMGPTTCMGMGHEKRIIRWYANEWNQFLEEVTTYKHRILSEYRSMFHRAKDHRSKCVKCQKRWIAMRKYQRGMLSGGTVKRSSSAAADCTHTTTAIPTVQDLTVEPDTGRALARYHTDGAYYYQAGSVSFGPDRGDWIGDCAVADYDTRFNRTSGSTENYQVSGTDGTWHAGSTSAAVGYSQPGFGTLSGNFNLECRDGTSLNVLQTDSFLMIADVDSSS